MLIENKKISVEVADDHYEKLIAKTDDQKQVLPSGDVRIHDAASVVRGMILSDAMAALGNLSEHEILKSEGVEVPDEDVMAAVREQLEIEYLCENCRYSFAETLMRWRGGHMMSPGMIADVEAARGRAAYTMRHGDISDQFAEAKQDLVDNKIHNIKYRENRTEAYGHALKIRVKSDAEMPRQIGLCRMDSSQG